MLSAILRKLKGNLSTAFAYFAVCPVVAIAVAFGCKIVTLKSLIFGDDYQLLVLFHKGRIAFYLNEIVNMLAGPGRFYPLFYQHYNLASAFCDLSVDNLAEHCFHVQAGMWGLMCVGFLALMACIARKMSNKSSILLYFFIPLSLLAMLFTPAMVSYFLMLIFPETLLCVFFPAFLLFYWIGYTKDNAVSFLCAWFFATLSLFCKENTFVIFTIISGIWLALGWKHLSVKHKIFLFGLLASSAGFLLMYYFIVYRHATSLYNQGRMGTDGIVSYIRLILKSYPAYLLAFPLGVFRFVRIIFLRDRKHLWADAVLFAALGLFLSFLALKLVDWWYWGTGTIFLFPVFFYWLIAYEKRGWRIFLLLAVVGCLFTDFPAASKRIGEIDTAQKDDRAFIEKLNQDASCHRIAFVSLENHSFMDECMYTYFRSFMTHLGVERKRKDEIRLITEFPKEIKKGDAFVVRNIPIPEAFAKKMADNRFECIGTCAFFKVYAYHELPYCDLPCSMGANDDAISLSGCWEFETQAGGRWLCGNVSEISLNLQENCDREVEFTLEGFPFFYNDFKENLVVCLVNGIKTQEITFRPNISQLKFQFSAGTLIRGENRITLKFREAHSPSEWGVADPRHMTFFVRTIKLTSIP